MSGWLPFERDISRLLKSDREAETDDDDDDDDPFSRDDVNREDAPGNIQAINQVRDVLVLPPFEQPALFYLNTPVFLGHGTADPKMPVTLGRRMASILSDGFRMDVT